MLKKAKFNKNAMITGIGAHLLIWQKWKNLCFATNINVFYKTEHCEKMPLVSEPQELVPAYINVSRSLHPIN